MSIPSSNFSVEFSPFHRVVQDGIDRLLEFIPCEEFTFIVKGEQFKSTLSEAVLISPKICENLKIDPSNRTFDFSKSEIEVNQFSVFLNLIRNREELTFSREDEIIFLSVCKLIGNERLFLLIFGSFHCEIASNISSKSITFCNLNIEECASNFNSYSTDELRSLPKETLHKLLSSPSFSIESEDSLLAKLIDLGSDYFEYWCYIEIPFLSTKGISQFVEIFPFDELRASHWEKIVFRLIGVCDETFRLRRNRKWNCKTQILKESTILSNIPTPLKQFESKKWKLLFRGSRDGFRSSDFHQKCDNESNTVTVILTTKDFVFGGFTPLEWDSSNSLKKDNSLRSFLFIVKDPRNSESKSFPVMNSNSAAIYVNSSFGPIFGGHDLLVSDRCNDNTSSYTKLGVTYRNDTGLKNTEVFTGEQHFQVKEIEVFSITL
jgi:hypothetical protein